MRTLSELNEQLDADLRNELAHIEETWWVLPGWALLVGFLVAFGSLFYFDGLAARLVGAGISIFCATQVAYRSGIHYGFKRGFQAGHERVVDG